MRRLLQSLQRYKPLSGPHGHIRVGVLDPHIQQSTFDVLLSGCPSSVRVTLPREFKRLPPERLSEARNICSSPVIDPGSHACFFVNGDPRIAYPYVFVRTFTGFLPKFDPGCTSSVFRVWKKLSIGALSQQFPLRLMLWRIPCVLVRSK
jgi:hypothetical protein